MQLVERPIETTTVSSVKINMLFSAITTVPYMMSKRRWSRTHPMHETCMASRMVLRKGLLRESGKKS